MLQLFDRLKAQLPRLYPERGILDGLIFPLGDRLIARLPAQAAVLDALARTGFLHWQWWVWVLFDWRRRGIQYEYYRLRRSFVQTLKVEFRILGFRLEHAIPRHWSCICRRWQRIKGWYGERWRFYPVEMFGVHLLLLIAVIAWTTNVFGFLGSLFDRMLAALDVLRNTGFDQATAADAFRSLAWGATGLAGGAAGLIGLILAMIRTWVVSNQNRVETRRVEMETFREAFAQLGNETKDDMTVRIGAVLALESLAKRSRMLHEPIYQALCAHVRAKRDIREDKKAETKPRVSEDADAGASQPPTDTNDSESDGEITKAVFDEALQSRLGEATFPADIQAILTAIGRRERRHERLSFIIDLSGTNLRRADLSSADLSNADLSYAWLNRGNLEAAKLTNATLCHTRFVSANLLSARLDLADLSNAELNGSTLKRASLDCAVLHCTDLSEINGAWLRCRFAITNKISLVSAQLFEADFLCTDLSEGYLRRAKLTDARLTMAKLMASDLTGAALYNTDLTYTNLAAAEFSEGEKCRFEVSDIAYYDTNTSLPRDMLEKTRARLVEYSGRVPAGRTIVGLPMA